MDVSRQNSVGFTFSNNPEPTTSICKPEHSEAYVTILLLYCILFKAPGHDQIPAPTTCSLGFSKRKQGLYKRTECQSSTWLTIFLRQLLWFWLSFFPSKMSPHLPRRKQSHLLILKELHQDKCQWLCILWAFLLGLLQSPLALCWSFWVSRQLCFRMTTAHLGYRKTNVMSTDP